ncbi:MAG: hypothetical protein ABIH34_04390 [Nanoarchaeota archaeon]
MPLFQCDNCGCMENTALSDCSSGYLRYIGDAGLIAEYRQKLGLQEDEPFGSYCSACCPLGDGKWHGKFDRIYLPKGEFETACNGNLRHKRTLDENIEKFAIRIEKS